MKTKHIKYFIATLISLTIFLGCSKSFLDQETVGSIPVAQFYKTDAQATDAIMDCYNYMETLNSSWVSSLWMMKESLSDDIYSGGQNAGDQIAYTNLGAYNFDATNSIITANYQYIVNVIGRCNVLIDNVPGTDAYQQIVIAEAKTLRAYNYLDMVSMWGPVPLMLHNLTSISQESQPNGQITAIYAQIDSDLSQAIRVLPLKSQLVASGSDVSRICRGTAQAILGKARLYNKDYAGAINALLPILPGGVDVDQYGLYQLSDEVINGDLTQILRKSTNWGKESMFEIDWSSARAQTWANSYGDIWNNPSRTNVSNMIIQLCGPRGDEGFNGGKKTYLINGGWGFGYPSLTSFNAYALEGDTIRRNAAVATRAQIDSAGGSMGNLSVTGDTMNGMWNCPGLIRLKYTTWEDETVPEVELNYETHLRLIRYSDVLLMAAEAYVMNGNSAAALPFINAVRTRANVAPLANVAMSDIKLERQVEFNYEGSRYQDLIRWGDAPTVLANQGVAIPTGIITNYNTAHPDTLTQKFGTGFKAWNILLPFPSAEVNANSNPNFHQNAGYN